MDFPRLLLCFIDESHQFLPDAGETVVSFAGVIIDAGGVIKLSDRLDHLLGELQPTGPSELPVEFHAYGLFHRRGRWSSLSPRQSIWVFEQVLQAVVECGFGLIFRLRRSAQEGLAESERSALISLLKQVEAFAEEVDAHTLAVCDERRGGGFKHVGDIIHQMSISLPTAASKRRTRVLAPMCFAPSHESRVLQAADILAFVLRRRVLIPHEVSAKAQRAMDALMHHLQSAALHVSIEDGD